MFAVWDYECWLTCQPNSYSLSSFGLSASHYRLSARSPTSVRRSPSPIPLRFRLSSLIPLRPKSVRRWTCSLDAYQHGCSADSVRPKAFCPFAGRPFARLVHPFGRRPFTLIIIC